MKPFVVAMWCSQPLFEAVRSRYADTFISYQGQWLLCTALRASDLRALELGGQNDATKPDGLRR